MSIPTWFNGPGGWPVPPPLSATNYPLTGVNGFPQFGAAGGTLTPTVTPSPLGGVAGVGGEGLAGDIAAQAAPKAGLFSRLGGLLGAAAPILGTTAAAYGGAQLLESVVPGAEIKTPTTTQELIDQIDKYKGMAQSGVTPEGEKLPGWVSKGLLDYGDKNSLVSNPVAAFVEKARAGGVPEEEIATFVQPLFEQLRAGKKPNELTVTKSDGSQILFDATVADQLVTNRAAVQAQQQQQQQAVKAQAAAQADQQRADQHFALSLQAQASEFMQPYLQQIVQGGDAEASALSSLASQVPAGMRGVFEQQANLARTGAYRLAGAYAAQTVMAGPMYMQGLAAQRGSQAQAQADLDYKNALTQQALAQAQYYASGQAGSGGAQSFDQTVAAQQTSP